jgi:hypothetical protein
MKILSFDVESNGLHGEAFAVAGLVMDDTRQVLSQFLARCPIPAPVDPWVEANVLGPMQALKETHGDGRAMRDAFWQWFSEAKEGCDLVVAANPYPVEARFLIACQNDDLEARQFDHPFPYFDLPSMLYTLGCKTKAQRHEFLAKAVQGATGEPHNPVWDAQATAMGALAAAEQIR